MKAVFCIKKFQQSKPDECKIQKEEEKSEKEKKKE
jgi:hypothetical protein